MRSIILSRFERGTRAYTFIDSYRACLDTDENGHSIQGYMDGLIRQMFTYHDEPTGWSFAEWRKGTNIASNLIGAHAIMLEYRIDRDDTEIVQRLHTKASDLGWTHFLIDTETRRNNTVTIVFPLTSPITGNQYARLASILAEQLDEYEMEHGCLAATHIVNVHRTSTPCVFAGTPIDPEAEIRRTAKMYQRLNARKFEGNRPAFPQRQIAEEPVVIEDGLFLFYETPEEKVRREALEVMAQLGFVE